MRELYDSQGVQLGPMVEAFCASLRKGLLFREERLEIDAVASEVAPVLVALCEAFEGAGVLDGAAVLDAHEALTMLTLLGRRVAYAGLTPTGALSVVLGIRHALRVNGLQLSGEAEDVLRMVCVEGYVAGREDREQERLERALASTQSWVHVVPGCVLWVVSGPLPVSLLEALVDELGRHLLAENAVACVVDVRALTEACTDKARCLRALAEIAASLGVGCHFVVSEPWDRLLRDSRVLQAGGGLWATLSQALDVALARAGYGLRRRWWGRV